MAVHMNKSWEVLRVYVSAKYSIAIGNFSRLTLRMSEDLERGYMPQFEGVLNAWAETRVYGFVLNFFSEAEAGLKQKGVEDRFEDWAEKPNADDAFRSLNGDEYRRVLCATIEGRRVARIELRRPYLEVEQDVRIRNAWGELAEWMGSPI